MAQTLVNGDENGTAGGTKSVRSLGRALDILGCFDVEHPCWDIPGLSQRTGLHKATVHRLVKTLEAKGFLTHDAKSGKYHPGLALMRIAYLGLSRAELVRVARPHMERLSRATGETVDLVVWAGEGMLTVAQVMTSRPFKPVNSVGRLFTDMANAAIKLFWDFVPEERRARLLAQPLERRTPYTIVDPQQFLMAVEKAKAEGISYDLQERDLGVVAFTAPVRDFSGEIRAGLALVCPPERFGAEEKESYVRSLKRTAMALSRDLGFGDGRPQP